MLSSRENEYIVKCKTIFFYFYLVNNVIYIEKFENNRNAIRKKLITDVKDFSVSMDDTNTIHIICLDTSDRLFHLYYKEEKWRKRFIADFGMNSVRLRDLRLFINHGKLNLLCLRSHIPRRNIWRIVHLIIENKSWNSYVIGEVCINKYLSPYKADIDTKGNIHIIYRSAQSNSHLLFYRVFNSRHNKWSLAAKISSDCLGVINMNILCDTQNIIHVTWSCLEGRNITVHYLKKVTSFSLALGWQKSRTFPKVISSFTNPVLVQDNDYIKLIWKQNERLYVTGTAVNKDMWCNVKTFETRFDCALRPIIYIGNVYKNESPVKVPFSYGYFDKEIFILGLDDIIEISDLSKLLEQKPIKESPKTESIKDKNGIEENFIKYIEDVKPQFINKEIVTDILNGKENTSSNIESESDKLKNLSKEEIMFRLSDLYDEIDNLKEQELNFLKQLEQLRDNQSQLAKRVEGIISVCSKIK